VYTRDTNAILYYLKDDDEAVAVLREVFARDWPIYVSAVTELELLAFGNLSGDEQSLIENLLATVAIIPVDSHIARIAALLRSRYTRDFRKISNLSIRKV